MLEVVNGELMVSGVFFGLESDFDVDVVGGVYLYIG